MIDERAITWPDPDTRAAIDRAVQRWPRHVDGTADQGIEPGPAESPSVGAEPPARARGVLVLRAAARRAQEVYPGAAGELIRRELLAVADFDYGPIGEQSLVTRLADHILTVNPAPDDGGRALRDQARTPPSPRPTGWDTATVG